MFTSNIRVVSLGSGQHLGVADRIEPTKAKHRALVCNCNNGRKMPVNDLLQRWSDGHVLCSDASILPTIGLRPHTLTAMATARCFVKKRSEQ